MSHPDGFTLAEIMIVVALVGLFSSYFISNFRSSAKNATARHQISSIIVADIRRAQSMALSGTQTEGQTVCGFGVHYLDQKSYLIYANNPNSAGTCVGSVNYNQNEDSGLETRTIANDNFIILWSPGSGNRDDIFFQPPDPRTYIDNKDITQDPAYTAAINVVLVGDSCPGADCTTITVYKSGKIDVAN